MTRVWPPSSGALARAGPGSYRALQCQAPPSATGIPPQPPTHWFRLRDGKVIEYWANRHRTDHPRRAPPRHGVGHRPGLLSGLLTSTGGLFASVAHLHVATAGATLGVAGGQRRANLRRRR